MARSAAAVAAESARAALSVRAPIFDPAHQRGLTSLLTQTYGKPVELNLRPINRPYYDAEILASHVMQNMKDRKSVVRRVIRDATWKAKLPSQDALARLQQERVHRRSTEQPLKLDDLTHAPANASQVLTALELPQVSSVQVSAGGRLSHRITANRADGKFARRGTTNKGPAIYLRGAQKANVDTALRSGKRRIGAYGIRAVIGHT